MAETGPFESSPRIASLPSEKEGRVSTSEMVESERRKAADAKAMRERHAEIEKADAEAGARLLESAFSEPSAPKVRDVPEGLPKRGGSETFGEREKIAGYANLADLAYVDFKAVPDGAPWSLEASGAALDPLSFPNARNVESVPKSELTEDERILVSYLDATPLEGFRTQLASFGKNPVPKDSADILYVATAGRFDASGTRAKMLARNVEEMGPETVPKAFAKIKTDPVERMKPFQLASAGGIPPGTGFERETVGFSRPKATSGPVPMTDDDKLRALRLQAWLEHVRKYKAEKGSELFEEMKARGFSVVDRFPDTENGESWSSGFAAMAVKDKEGRITVAVRGTELSDFLDIWADAELVLKRVPAKQARDLVKFMDRVLSKLPPGEKIRMSGHSLGWALTQIGSVMYGDRIEEAYTFNSPGAKKLRTDPKSQPEAVRARFEKYAEFGYDKGNPASVENRMVNVAGSKWPSLIADLNEDVGFYEIKLKDVQSHSITTMAKEISKETTELKVVDVRKKGDGKPEKTDERYE